MPDKDPEYPLHSSDYIHVRRIRSAIEALTAEESRVRMVLSARAGREADRVASERGWANRLREREKDRLEERRREIMRAAGAAAAAGTLPCSSMDGKPHSMMSDGADADADEPPPPYIP